MIEQNAANLQELLTHPQLWRARQLEAPPAADRLASGYPLLDDALAGAGWPRDGLVELLADRIGIGELRLLAPALAALSRQQQRWLLWVNPPHIPYAPALAALGIDVGKILLVHPRRHEDALWSLEQALKSGTCSAALGWLDERRLAVRDLRRLQLAARQGGTLATLFRPRQAAARASMAELRILLQPPARQRHPATPQPADLRASASGDLLELEIIKRRGGWARAPFMLPLQPPAARLTSAELKAHVEGWRRRARHRQTGLAAADVPAAAAGVAACAASASPPRSPNAPAAPVAPAAHASFT